MNLRITVIKNSTSVMQTKDFGFNGSYFSPLKEKKIKSWSNICKSGQSYLKAAITNGFFMLFVKSQPAFQKFAS